MSRKRATKLPYTYLDNILSRRRVEMGLTISELGKRCCISQSKMGQYLSGQLLPSDTDIYMISQVLGIDKFQVSSEFQRIYRDRFKVKESKQVVVSAKANVLEKKRQRKEARKAKREAEKEQLKEAQKIIREAKKRENIKPEPITIDLTAKRMEVLRLVYDQVDYATYKKIKQVLS